MVTEIRWNLDPRYNEPLYHELLGITSNFLTPPVIVKYLKQNLDITKPLYSKHILQVPCPFLKSRFHCTKNKKNAHIYVQYACFKRWVCRSAIKASTALNCLIFAFPCAGVPKKAFKSYVDNWWQWYMCINVYSKANSLCSFRRYISSVCSKLLLTSDLNRWKDTLPDKWLMLTCWIKSTISTMYLILIMLLGWTILNRSPCFNRLCSS